MILLLLMPEKQPNDIKSLVKCRICSSKIPKMDFEDHLRDCIHSIEYSYDPSSFYAFHDILNLIKKHLGEKEVIKYINSFRTVDLEGLFSPIDYKKTPISFPIYNILDSIINGLKSKDPDFSDVTLHLLWTFYYELKRLLESKFDYSDYYLASILELFNVIYEQKLEGYISNSNLKGSFEHIINKHKEKVFISYFDIVTNDWGKEIHFLDEKDLFKQELYKRLKRYGLVDDIDINDFNKNSLSKDLIRSIIIANFQNKDIQFIFPHVKDFFKYQTDFIDNFNLKLDDFLEYIIDIKEAELIRQIPMGYFNIGTKYTINKYSHKENLIFNNNRQVIYLRRNKWGFSSEVLEVFPEQITRLEHLQSLDLSRNKISRIPSSIDNLAKLKFLLLERNKLSSLPESIGNLRNLKELYLSGNNLRIIPKSIGKLESLEWLILGENYLKDLPSSMKNLTKLSHIDLADNQFRKFPEVLSNLQSLEEIVLSNNYIQAIPETIVNLKSLRSLFLKNSKISKIPDSLRKRKSLRIIR